MPYSTVGTRGSRETLKASRFDSSLGLQICSAGPQDIQSLYVQYPLRPWGHPPTEAQFSILPLEPVWSQGRACSSAYAVS